MKSYFILFLIFCSSINTLYSADEIFDPNPSGNLNLANAIQRIQKAERESNLDKGDLRRVAIADLCQTMPPSTILAFGDEKNCKIWIGNIKSYQKALQSEFGIKGSYPVLPNACLYLCKRHSRNLYAIDQEKANLVNALEKAFLETIPQG